MIFFSLLVTSCQKETEHAYLQKETTLHKIDILIFQREYENAFLTSKELLFSLDEPKELPSLLLHAAALDRICKITGSSIYAKYLQRDLQRIEPLLTKDLEQKIQFLTLQAHLHVYKHEAHLAKKYYDELVFLYPKLIHSLSLQRSFIDSKALAFHQIKSDFRLLQLESAEIYFLENNLERAHLLLSQSVIDKNTPYLKRRLAYLNERLPQLKKESATHEGKVGLTPLQFELLQTYKELSILNRYFHYYPEEEIAE